eukprot:1138884-Pelagomonas_calceolata.AAC.5
MYMQWENFRVELASLRRSVRGDEYARVSGANPPQSLPGKVRAWYLLAMHRVFSSPTSSSALSDSNGANNHVLLYLCWGRAPGGTAAN